MVTHPVFDNSRPLIYLKYEGPAVTVDRSMIRTPEQGKELKDYFEVWFDSDCFVKTVRKYENGKLVWTDEYEYNTPRGVRPWGVKGVREENGVARDLKFDKDGRII